LSPLLSSVVAPNTPARHVEGYDDHDGIQGVHSGDSGSGDRGGANMQGFSGSSGSGPAVIPRALYAGRAYAHPVELLDLYRTLSDLAGLPQPQSGVQGNSLVGAFRNQSGDVKAVPGAISQTTRCRFTAHGTSGSQFVDAAAKDADTYAACVRTNCTQFGFMGYSLRTNKWRCVLADVTLARYGCIMVLCVPGQHISICLCITTYSVFTPFCSVAYMLRHFGTSVCIGPSPPLTQRPLSTNNSYW